MTLETREKSISEFSVSFKAQPYNEVSVLLDTKILASVGFPERVKALEVYQNIKSTRDAKNFVNIANNGSHPAFEMNGERGARLKRIMESNVKIMLVRKIEERS